MGKTTVFRKVFWIHRSNVNRATTKVPATGNRLENNIFRNRLEKQHFSKNVFGMHGSNVNRATTRPPVMVKRIRKTAFFEERV